MQTINNSERTPKTKLTLSVSGLSKILHPERDKRTFTERLLSNLSHSNYGLNKNASQSDTSHSAGLDTFEITQTISELLSPACGMTDEEKKAYLARIRAKLENGEKLTAEEMRFLQAEDPVLYQQAARIQSMRDALETKLNHCSSKSEAQSVYSQTLDCVSDKDPMKQYIIAAYNRVWQDFRESDTYQALPDEEDQTTIKSQRRQP